MNEHNVFAGAFVDRSGERRKDEAWLRAAIDADDSVFLPVWGDRCPADGQPPTLNLLRRDELPAGIDHDEFVFLGLFANRAAFAFAVHGDDPPCAAVDAYRDLRFLGMTLPAAEANLAAHARALILWHATQLHCGVCSAPARPVAAGNARRCSNDDCGRDWFPRTDPAVIVLVTDGDRCLLGRQPGWPDGLYSTIAGFVEPGESLEDAVRREVFEETNIRVAAVRYHSSQPWPFPSSLMLGFFAEAASAAICLNDGELEDARWIARNDVASGLTKLPNPISIARRLVDTWLRDEHPR